MNVAIRTTVTRARCLVGTGLLALALVSCGNSENEGGGLDVVTAIGGSTFQGKRGEPQTDAQVRRDVETVLGRFDGPLKAARVLETGNVAILLQPVTNGSYQTWLTPSGQSLTLKGGVMTATRGLGYDLLSSQADPTTALIRNRQAGTANRLYRHLTGDNRDVPLLVSCTITNAGSESFTLLSGATRTATRMNEICTGDDDLRIDNDYWVTSGEIVQSRQWVSREIGSLLIQSLRG